MFKQTGSAWSAQLWQSATALPGSEISSIVPLEDNAAFSYIASPTTFDLVWDLDEVYIEIELGW